MYREIAGTDERVRAIPGVRDRRVRATKVRLYVLGAQKKLPLIEMVLLSTHICFDLEMRIFL